MDDSDFLTLFALVSDVDDDFIFFMDLNVFELGFLRLELKSTLDYSNDFRVGEDCGVNCQDLIRV